MASRRNVISFSKNLESNVIEFLPRLKSRKQFRKFTPEQSKLAQLIFKDSTSKVYRGFDTPEQT
jgi:hypothetical protein